MKIFIIHPVRDISCDMLNDINLHVATLEGLGHEVYDPSRDTDQDDDTGLRICKDNRAAIEDADLVCFAWDGKSKGCLFDLGMAFAMEKPIYILSYWMPELTGHKSFQNMAAAWELETWPQVHSLVEVLAGPVN